LQIYINSQALGAQPLGSLADNYSRLVLGNFLGIPNLVWFLAITAVVMYVIWNKTTLGKNMFAIGGNPEAASVSGVNLVKNIMMIFLISGVLYGIAGFLEAARIGSVTTSTGTNYELDAIASCVVGGVSFSGGVGTISGVLIGTVILQFINYGLQYIGVNVYLQGIIKGLIIIAAVSIDVRKYIAKK
ncbi:MAG: beta-methylgalactoside transporter, partial [Tissierellia bacterium]|nr:beta-methylgalactoside transporter [Tissierellia bacterium]